ncbi:MAG: DUF86 domain-containing protein [Candidatus Aminicenantes bacterium]|nr:DUF86 domain-containing protein [Candidatus Aminicenantes bacterium]
MTSGDINGRVITQRAIWIKDMLQSLRELPLENEETFLDNKHLVAAAESYLRRALEALFDLGRHILAKKFAYPAPEYKKIAVGLAEKHVIEGKNAELMRIMAGYRNRMVHFYQEITPKELFQICSQNLSDIEQLLEALLKWVRSNTE